ncbi:MAG: energy-coupling factor transporter transmembrane protein EcfT [Rothia sp. (in: high G+C Gram-positive bacteria)]|nr:energy-coupling factor transporter transmembrane protein EcfT [Rothia sp. (in: high G+C Gram-positive bacteria)]
MLNQLFSIYRDEQTPIHRLPLAAKWAFIFMTALAINISRDWLVPALFLVLVVLIGRLAGLGFKDWYAAVKSIIWLLLAMSVYYLIFNKILQGLDLILGLLTLLFASKILLYTTPVTVLVDGFITAWSPLKFLGLNPRWLGLAFAIMLRSIPAIMDRWILLDTAVLARGLKKSPFLLFTPLIIHTVSYAQDTADALAARGLDSREHKPQKREN